MPRRSLDSERPIMAPSVRIEFQSSTWPAHIYTAPSNLTSPRSTTSDSHAGRLQTHVPALLHLLNHPFLSVLRPKQHQLGIGTELRHGRDKAIAPRLRPPRKQASVAAAV